MSNNNRTIKLLREYVTPLNLFCLYPFLTFYGNNTTESLDIQFIVIVWLAFLLFSFVVLIVLIKIINNTLLLRKIVNIFLVAIFTLFNFNSIVIPLISFIEGALRVRYYFFLWGGLLAVACLITWYFSQSTKSTKLLTITISAMMLVSVMNTGIYIYSYYNINKIQDKSRPLITEKIDSKTDKGLNNVYHFLFDGYGRSDRILKETGYDSYNFINELNQWGFHVMERANSNYMHTYASIATMKNMDYLVEPNGEYFTSMFTKIWGYFKQNPNSNPSQIDLKNMSMLITTRQNNSSKMFKSLGYTTGHSARGSSGCSPPAQDRCIAERRVAVNLSRTAWALLDTTPFGMFVRRQLTKEIAWYESDGRSFLNFQAPYIKDFVNDTSGPTFIYSYVILPHMPYLDEKCELISLFETEKKNKKEQLAQRETTRICLMQQIRTTIPDLIKNDPEGIFVISADHGFAVTSFWDNEIHEMDENDIENRFGILLAIKAPERCEEYLYESMSPVNIYRFVQSCLLNKKPNYLSDKSYLISHQMGNTDSVHEPIEIQLWQENNSAHQIQK